MERSERVREIGSTALIIGLATVSGFLLGLASLLLLIIGFGANDSLVWGGMAGSVLFAALIWLPSLLLRENEYWGGWTVAGGSGGYGVFWLSLVILVAWLGAPFGD